MSRSDWHLPSIFRTLDLPVIQILWRPIRIRDSQIHHSVRSCHFNSNVGL